METINRRNFLTRLGIGAAACAVLPTIREEPQELVVDYPLNFYNDGDVVDTEWVELSSHNVKDMETQLRKQIEKKLEPCQPCVTK